MPQQYTKDGVRLERTGWRDATISQRHRQWGFDCPAVDIDFAMLEYNHGSPVAIVEYKHRAARMPNLQHASYRAIRKLADGYADGPLPFLLAFYCPDDWWFKVFPANDTAQEFLDQLSKKYGKVFQGEAIPERRFVAMLALLRRDKLTAKDNETIARLKTTVPAMASWWD